MTTRILSGYYKYGYTENHEFTALSVTSAGTIAGGGLQSVFGSLVNAGLIENGNKGSAVGMGGKGDAGADIFTNTASGYVNGADVGVLASGAATIVNDGTIRGGGFAVQMTYGGVVTNGGYGVRGAVIAGHAIGISGQTGTVTNFATIAASIDLFDGGTIVNGAAGLTTVSIGGAGIYVAGAAGYLSNFATIAASVGSGYAAVSLAASGLVTNGSATDSAALISGASGARLAQGATLRNFADVEGLRAGAGAYGVAVLGGGTVINGTGLDTGARIAGYTGVVADYAVATVVNGGTILGDGFAPGQYGVELVYGGSLTNGGGADRAALIEGYAGVVAIDAAATVANFGTILAAGATSIGVCLRAGGVLANGSANNSRAVIEGYVGVAVASGKVTNFATIEGTGDAGGAAARLGAGSGLINGSANDAKASLDGYAGVIAYGANVTVTNFGAIEGEAGTALAFTAASDTLLVEAGSAFVGSVSGGGGTLVLDSGQGTIAGLTGDAAITISGSMAATPFAGFSTLGIGQFANFVESASAHVAAGQAVTVTGILTLAKGTGATITNAGLIETLKIGVATIAGGLANTGTIEANGGVLTIDGSVTGKGSAVIAYGTLAALGAFGETVAFTGATGTLTLGQSQAYAGAVSGLSKTGGTALDLRDIAFTGSGEASFSGTAKGGTLTVTDGTHTAHIALKGNYVGVSFVAASDGAGGVVVTASGARLLVAAMAAMGGAAGALTAPATVRGPAPPSLAAPPSFG